jgi:hypothetical protein
VTRPPARRRDADEPNPPDDESATFAEDDVDEDVDDEDLDGEDDDDDEEDVEEDDDAEDLADDEASAEPRRTKSVERFWRQVRVDPIEIALPAGVGYTLRAYRQNTDITPADVSAREDELPMPSRRQSVVELDEDDYEDESDRARSARFGEDADDERDLSDEDFEDEDFEDEADSDEDEDEAPEEVVEEVPLFLSQGGHLLLFRSADSLVDFVTSDAEHDLQQIDTWESVTRGIHPEYVVPDGDDTYELDLVVKNLRGGHDAWDPELLIRAGQLARDLSHALRIEPVVLALAPGAPLDDLDEALRTVADGGVGGFFARRRLKKIGTETASLAWRTVVGKISAIVDWRD